MAAAAVVYGIIMRKRLKPVNVRTIVALLIIAVLPYLWYVFALNHSGVHFRFTYRTQVMTIMCILFALGVMLRPALRDIRDRGKNALAALHQKEVEEAS